MGMTFEEMQRKEKTDKIRRRPRHVESRIQKECVRVFRLKYPKYLCFAVGNGGGRSRIEAAIMNGEGVLPGVSDLIIVADVGVLFVEIKTDKGKLSPHQEEFQARVEALGYKYIICRSSFELLTLFEEWLKEKMNYVPKND